MSRFVVVFMLVLALGACGSSNRGTFPSPNTSATGNGGDAPAGTKAKPPGRIYGKTDPRYDYQFLQN